MTPKQWAGIVGTALAGIVAVKVFSLNIKVENPTVNLWPSGETEDSRCKDVVLTMVAKTGSPDRQTSIFAWVVGGEKYRLAGCKQRPGTSSVVEQIGHTIFHAEVRRNIATIRIPIKDGYKYRIMADNPDDSLRDFTFEDRLDYS